MASRASKRVTRSSKNAGAAGKAAAAAPPALPACRYGLQCFRKNPVHFKEFAHPDAVLIRAGIMPAPPQPNPRQAATVPAAAAPAASPSPARGASPGPSAAASPPQRKPCIYGAQCYRRNPAHLAMFWHPPPPAVAAPAAAPPAAPPASSSAPAAVQPRVGDKRRSQAPAQDSMSSFSSSGSWGASAVDLDSEEELKEDMAAVLAGYAAAPAPAQSLPKSHYGTAAPKVQKDSRMEDDEEQDGDDDDDDDSGDDDWDGDGHGWHSVVHGGRALTAKRQKARREHAAPPEVDAMSQAAAEELAEFLQASSDSEGEDAQAATAELMEATLALPMAPPPPLPFQSSSLPTPAAPRPLRCGGAVPSAQQPPMATASARAPTASFGAAPGRRGSGLPNRMLAAAMQSTVVTDLADLQRKGVSPGSNGGSGGESDGSSLSIVTSGSRGSAFSSHSGLECQQTILTDGGGPGDSGSSAPPASHPGLDISMSFISDTSSLPSRSFEILDTLGQGQFATVFRARPKFPRADRREFVALKVIKKPRFTQTQLDVIRTEAEIMRQLQHPGCIQLLDSYETPSRYILVLELLEGGELFTQIVARRCFDELRVARVVLQLSQALIFLHQQGIVHRDIKPENILLERDTEDSPVKLADFGLAFVKGEMDADSRRDADEGAGPAKKARRQICGTPNYIAPEVLDHEQVYEEAIDIWSLGVVTYIMLCGFPPFAGDTMVQLLGNIRKAQVEFPSEYWGHISDEAKDLVRGMLTKDPAARLSAQEVLAHPFVCSCLPPLPPGMPAADDGESADSASAQPQQQQQQPQPQQPQESQSQKPRQQSQRQQQQKQQPDQVSAPPPPPPVASPPAAAVAIPRQRQARPVAKANVPLFADDAASSVKPSSNPKSKPSGGSRLKFTLGGMVR